MENGDKKTDTDNNILEDILSGTMIHRILAHSYYSFFLFLLLGVILDIIFHIQAFESSFIVPAGFIILVLATALILWAQNTSRNLHREDISKESFLHGPYCYTRSPTHYGLFLLLLGLGMIANAFFVIMFTIVSLLVTKFFFLKKEEDLLEKKYGDAYKEYKKSVKF